MSELGLCLILSLLIVGVTVFFLCRMWKRDAMEFTPSVVTDLKYDPETEILTFKGGVTGKPYKARGGCTVWHSMSGRRLDTLTESKLYDIWAYWKYNK